MKNSIFYLMGCALIILSSCSPKIIPGQYTTTVGEKIFFAGTNVEFLPDEKISILHWTDEGNRYGEGSYEIKGKNLTVTFDSVDMVMAHYTEEPISNGYADAISYVVEGEKNLIGAGVSIFDDQNGFMKGGVIGNNLKCSLHVPSYIKSDYISISHFGYETMKIPIREQTSTKYKVQMMETFTTYFKKGEVKTYNIKKKGDEVVLTEGKKSYFLKPKGK